MSIDIHRNYKVAARDHLEIADGIGFRFLEPKASASRLIVDGDVLVTSGGPYESIGVVDYQDVPVEFWNREGASFTVRALDKNGSATGFYIDSAGSTFVNDGVFTVEAGSNGTAVGGSFNGGAGLLNTGALQVSGGHATGFRANETNSVQNSGSIRVEAGSGVGIALSSRSGLLNLGEVTVVASAEAIGVKTSWDPVETGWLVVNHGTISASATDPAGQSIGLDISVATYADATLVLDNRGLIEAEIAIRATRHPSYAFDTIQIYSNRGEIRGDFALGAEDDHIVNKGLIVGDLDLGGGDDLLDTHRGQLVGDVAGGYGNDTLIGSAADDVLRGGGGASAPDTYGFDRLVGGRGADRLFGDDWDDNLIGGRGADELTGGAGTDMFVFKDIRDSEVRRPDLITDLQEKDRINLAGIDADTTLAGDQRFAFVDSFEGVAGQAVLAYDAETDVTRLSLDVDGDAMADSLILITGDWTQFERFLT